MLKTQFYNIIRVADITQQTKHDLCPNLHTTTKTDDTTTATLQVLDIDDSPPVFNQKILSKGYLVDSDFDMPIFTLSVRIDCREITCLISLLPNISKHTIFSTLHFLSPGILRYSVLVTNFSTHKF